jgi:hypothetical protein
MRASLGPVPILSRIGPITTLLPAPHVLVNAHHDVCIFLLRRADEAQPLSAIGVHTDNVRRITLRSSALRVTRLIG